MINFHNISNTMKEVLHDPQFTTPVPQQAKNHETEQEHIVRVVKNNLAVIFKAMLHSEDSYMAQNFWERVSICSHGRGTHVSSTIAELFIEARRTYTSRFGDSVINGATIYVDQWIELVDALASGHDSRNKSRKAWTTKFREWTEKRQKGELENLADKVEHDLSSRPQYTQRRGMSGSQNGRRPAVSHDNAEGSQNSDSDSDSEVVVVSERKCERYPAQINDKGKRKAVEKAEEVTTRPIKRRADRYHHRALTTPPQSSPPSGHNRSRKHNNNNNNNEEEDDVNDTWEGPSGSPAARRCATRAAARTIDDSDVENPSHHRDNNNSNACPSEHNQQEEIKVLKTSVLQLHNRERNRGKYMTTLARKTVKKEFADFLNDHNGELKSHKELTQQVTKLQGRVEAREKHDDKQGKMLKDLKNTVNDQREDYRALAEKVEVLEATTKEYEQQIEALTEEIKALKNAEFSTDSGSDFEPDSSNDKKTAANATVTWQEFQKIKNILNNHEKEFERRLKALEKTLCERYEKIIRDLEKENAELRNMLAQQNQATVQSNQNGQQDQQVPQRQQNNNGGRQAQNGHQHQITMPSQQDHRGTSSGLSVFGARS